MNSPAVAPITPEMHAQRRSAAFERLGEAVMVLPAAAVQYASRDSEHPYAPDRELAYLTGIVEPDAVAVLVGGAEPRTIVFVRERDPDVELWAGPRLGPEGVGERLALDDCRPRARLSEELPALLDGARRIHFRLGRGDDVERLVLGALARARHRGPRKGSGPRAVVDPGEVLDDLRLLKSRAEVALLREACRISVEGHVAGAGVMAPGVGEWAVQAAIDGAFRASGAAGPAYGTIVGSGANACVLHYVDNSSVIQPGGLVLVDAGAQYGLYAGDVTRTYPGAGRFTPRQRDVYRVVDGARRAAIAEARPGRTVADVHAAATASLVEGLVALGVLEGDPTDLAAAEAHKPFYPHQTSHWLGLDVHDVGDYARAGAPRALEPGMVFTVEPGLYFRPGVGDGAAEPFAGIGVRIEDDVVITADGCEVLTSSLPTGVDEIEALVLDR